MMANHFPHHLLHHVVGHAIIDAATGADDKRMIAQLLGLVNEIVGVYTDAVTAHQARREAQRIPLGIHGLQHFIGIDIHQVENHGQLIHESDIDIPLGIFHQLRRFGHRDGGHRIHTGLDDGAVDRRHQILRPLIHTGNDFHYIF